ncbi:MAG: MurT ligase domain-containing protein [Propionibacteriaceae bacterium]|nr:MurT ligase domain-containing protein [Propionibacteriaceae bacterium]
MARLRFLVALWAAKATRLGLRLLRRRGTQVPGRVALKLCPGFLAQVGRPDRVLAVTGTNGKTTVCNLIIDALQLDSRRVLANDYGSNTLVGLCACLAAGASWTGRSRHDIAVFEVDERSSRLIYPHLPPDLLVVTNLFRDTIMRNAHTEFMVDFLNSAIPAQTELILNADDLISSALAPANRRCHFALGRLDSDVTESENLIVDITCCPKCQTELVFDYRRYHHIGHAHCPACGFASPQAEYLGQPVDLTGRTMAVLEAGQSWPYRLVSDSLVNAYNQMAAIAALRRLGLTHDRIAQLLAQVSIVATRFGQVEAGGVTIMTQLMKDENALACSRVFDHVRRYPGRKVVVAATNYFAYSKDWSENTYWMWCADFEFLADPSISQLVLWSPRIEDVLLRLLWAGCDMSKVEVARTEAEAAELATLDPEQPLFILYSMDGLPFAERTRRRLVARAQAQAQAPVPAEALDRAEAATPAPVEAVRP